MPVKDNQGDDPPLLRSRRRSRPSPFIAYSGPRSHRRNELAIAAAWILGLLAVWLFALFVLREWRGVGETSPELSRMEHVTYALGDAGNILVYHGGHQVAKMEPGDPKYASLRYLLAEHGMPSMSASDRSRAKDAAVRQQVQIGEAALPDFTAYPPAERGFVSSLNKPALDAERTKPVPESPAPPPRRAVSAPGTE